jgi:hypothetical protein
MDMMPLMINGKIDRQALKIVTRRAEWEPIIESAESADASMSDLERELVLIWREILKRTDIGLRESFFNLGGHSLSANLLIHRIHRLTGLELRIVDIFYHPTIAQLSKLIVREGKGEYDLLEL